MSSPPPTTPSTPGVLLCVPPPLVHAGPPDDETRRQEATDHLARWPALQVMADVLNALRGARVVWWAPVDLAARWPARVRLEWLEQRPDLRLAATRALTGLELRSGRDRSVAFQAELVEATIDPADVPARTADAFDARDLVVYGPVKAMWDEVMSRVPWGAEAPPPLVEAMLSAILSDRGRPPVLTAWQLRAAVDPRAWQAHVPARLRAAVDEARLHKELVDPSAPFTAREELAIVTPAVLAANLPLPALHPAFLAAGRTMGLEVPAPSQSQPAPRAGVTGANDGDVEVTVSTG